jgi:hypothetical protein
LYCTKDFAMKALKILTVLALVLMSLQSCKYLKEQKWFTKDIDTIANQLIDTSTIKADTAQVPTIVQETEPMQQNYSEPGFGYTSDKYYMIVGSFLSKPFAEKYAKKMQNKGYNPQIIYSSSQGFYRVSAKSYTDLSSAKADMSNFRDGVTPRAWIHIKKK